MLHVVLCILHIYSMSCKMRRNDRLTKCKILSHLIKHAAQNTYYLEWSKLFLNNYCRCATLLQLEWLFHERLKYIVTNGISLQHVRWPKMIITHDSWAPISTMPFFWHSFHFSCTTHFESHFPHFNGPCD